VGVELGDEHACEALAAMGDTSAIAEMRAELRESSGASRVRIARAIHALSPDESLANELVEVLEDPSLFWSQQMNAAIGLRDFGDPGSERALLDAIQHNVDYLVRYHASESLLQRWHVTPPDISKHPDIFELISKPDENMPAAERDPLLSEAVTRLKRLRKRDP